MSNTTPEPPSPESAADEAVVEPVDVDADIANPPSSPVPARGHVNSPEPAAASSDAGSAPEAVTAADTPAADTPAADAAETEIPAAERATREPVSEPEPAATSDEDVAAAVARTTAEPDDVVVEEVTVTEVYAAGPVEHAAPAAAEPAGVASAAAAAAIVADGAQLPGAYGQPVTPIYITAPLPPKKKSNRGFGMLFALAGTIAFGLVYGGVVAAVIAVIGGTHQEDFVDNYLGFLAGAQYWVSVIAFFVWMTLLIQIINRAGWWAYIIGGFFVAALVYASFIGAVVIANASDLTPAEAGRLLGQLWFDPFAIWAGIVAREVAIWTGLWLAIRGRKLKIRNAEALAEFESTLASGPRPNGFVSGA